MELPKSVINPLESLKNLKKNDKKPIPRFLKRIKKIESVSKYEEYKEMAYVSLLTWCIDNLLIRAFLIFLTCLLCLSALGAAILSPLQVVFLAEGSSILWYLIIQFKTEWVKSR